MADTPAPASTGKSGGFRLNIKNPGMKEYLIVGGIALAIGYWYFKRKAAAAASTGSATPATTVVSGGGNGLGLGELLQWITNHNSSPTPASTSGNATTTISLAPWQNGLPESQQAWNADLNNIAAHYGISVQQLEQMNPQIKNPNKVAPGTLVNVPAGTP